MYDAAAEYYTAVRACKSEAELEELRRNLVELEAEYSDNPAYLALIRQKYAAKEWEVKNNASSK